MDFIDLARTVNFATGSFTKYVPNDKTEADMIAFLDAYKNDTDSLLNIDCHTGFQIGQAFQNTINNHRNLDDSDKRFCIAGGIISFTKALEMGTMQSVMAIEYLAQLVQSNKDITDVYFFSMNDFRMTSDFDMPTGLVNTSNLTPTNQIKKRLLCLLKFLIAIKDNSLENDVDNEGKAGRYYLAALFKDAYDKIKGYRYFEFIS